MHQHSHQHRHNMTSTDALHTTLTQKNISRLFLLQQPTTKYKYNTASNASNIQESPSKRLDEMCDVKWIIIKRIMQKSINASQFHTSNNKMIIRNPFVPIFPTMSYELMFRKEVLIYF